MEKIRAAVFSADDVAAKIARQWIDSLGSSDADVQAKKLYKLLNKGVTNFLKSAFVYSWVLHSATEPTVYQGGYIETPGGPLEGVIADLELTALRLADDLSFSGGIYKLTRSWLCADSAHWDADLYTA